MVRSVTKSKIRNNKLDFQKKLVLNQYLMRQFGISSLEDLESRIQNYSLQEIDYDGFTEFYHYFYSILSTNSSITKEQFRGYDKNIVLHLKKINEKRQEPLSLKYFQYLTILFVEYYLDRFFNHKNEFLRNLNKFVDEFNQSNPNDKIERYSEADLNKIAIWNATGSGKTIIMHINYYQYLYYAQNKNKNKNKINHYRSNFILLTPKESLSRQHKEEYDASGIPAERFDRNSTQHDEIIILENTKLDDKNGEKKVDVDCFEDKNIVFVDEGHRGSSGTRSKVTQ